MSAEPEWPAKSEQVAIMVVTSATCSLLATVIAPRFGVYVATAVAGLAFPFAFPLVCTFHKWFTRGRL